MNYDNMLNRLKESLEREEQRLKNNLTEIVKARFFVFNIAEFAYQKQCDDFNKSKYGFSFADISHTTDVNVEFDIKVGSWKTFVDFKLHTYDGRSFYLRAVFDDVDVPNYWGANTLAISAPLSKRKGGYFLCLFSKEEFDSLGLNEFDMYPYDADKYSYLDLVIPKEGVVVFVHKDVTLDSFRKFCGASYFFFNEDGSCYESPDY
jgi:hypothetical protein